MENFLINLYHYIQSLFLFNPSNFNFDKSLLQLDHDTFIPNIIQKSNIISNYLLYFISFYNSFGLDL